MSKKRILNITTEKKQDNMLQVVPNDPTNPAGAFTIGDYTVGAGTTAHTFLFCPTARLINNEATNDTSARTRPDTFARGYKEVTTFRIGGPSPWRMRRIVFSLKGFPFTLTAASNLFTPDFYIKFNTAIGYTRLMSDLTPTSFGPNPVSNQIFKGTQNVDWFSPFNAKVDTQRITVHSDRTMNFNPPNQGGQTRVVKNWYPMNKTLMYNDVEDGPVEGSTAFATQSKVGMGDVFIFDILQATTSDGTSSIAINNEGTYYWHER